MTRSVASRVLRSARDPDEAGAALPAQAVLGDHAGDQLRLGRIAAQRVGLGQRGVQALPDQGDHVDPDEVSEPEDAGRRDAERLRQGGVRDLNVEAERDRLVDRGRHPVVADAVGDEAGRVAADHHALAEPAVGEVADGRQGPGPRARAGHKLQKAHGARGVEEVRDEEVLGEARGQPLRQGGEREGRGV